MTEAQLYWDYQDSQNSGWWLRYYDHQGTEQGIEIECSEHASLSELAEAVLAESHNLDDGKIVVIRNERVRGWIRLKGGEASWGY